MFQAAIADIIQNVPLGQHHRVEGGGTDRCIRRNLRQGAANAAVEIGVIQTLFGIADALGKHRHSKARHAQRQRRAQGCHPLPVFPDVRQIYNGEVQ